ncbi:hypothetical protein [Methanobrevibacter sp.]|uniref:hypothetical protein n=1 Tax=Methanobrevibacter sp. TaxID=66852 RepID=UPI0025EF80E9|nr:hypothetical protein [Methanobrevibacter sp.]MBQ2666381.1 hypothetical protein [Methanobrevibacter sp.]MBQ2666926.1 hypothetical protein [Methanobrevibacter sp.]
MKVRKATANDLDDIMEIYRIAQDFMIKNGNPNQWGHTYPSLELIKEDIESGICNIICDENDIIHGVFALVFGDEPTYENIENGEWLNDDEYVTIHRIAGDGKVGGIFNSAIEYCKNICNNIRIDTHESNNIMQKLIEKNGFQKCGIIYVRDSPRIAYHWSKNNLMK